MVDLRELLKKYMKMVAFNERVTFVPDGEYSKRILELYGLSEEEFNELNQVELEAFPDEDNRP